MDLFSRKMTKVLVFIFFLITFLIPQQGRAAPAIGVGSSPYFSVVVGTDLYVANTASSSLSVIDTATNVVTHTITVGSNPRSPIVVGTDLYVNNYGSNNISVVDTLTKTVTDTIAVGNFPYALANVGTKIYVANTFSNNVSVIDTTTNTLVTTIPVGSGPRYPMVVGTDVYVSNYGSNSISVISTLTDTVTHTISVGAGPYLGTLVGSYFYISNIAANTVSVIDTVSKTVSTTVTVGSHPGGSLLIGTKLYVNNTNASSVSVIDTLSNTVVATIGVGSVPYDFTTVGSYIYVGNYNSNSVSVIDTDTDTVITTVSVGTNPHSSSLVGTNLYVNNVFGESVSIIDTLTNTIVRVNPKIVSAQILGKQLTLTFDYQMDSTLVPALRDFLVKVQGVPTDIEDVSIDNEIVSIRLATPAATTETVTVGYVQGVSLLSDVDGMPVVNFSNYPVSNIGFVTSGGVFDVTNSSAAFEGEILSNINDSDAATVRGFEYGETTELKLGVREEDFFWDGVFVLSGESEFRCGTRYYYRAFATNSLGTSYGERKVFSTERCENRSGFLLEDKKGASSIISNGSIQTFMFLNQLRPGLRHPDVKELQKFLNTHGFSVATEGSGAQGQETDFFGIKTKEALVRFQEVNAGSILSPLGLRSGTGILGPKTREFINNLPRY